MKCLIAVNPNGAACFISDLFEGSISDVDIFDQCGILQQINSGDACEMPQNSSQQGSLYSSYKSHCTKKCLIAVNPNGAACFISDLFEGSLSNVDIFDQCGILQQINPGHALLVDKGSTVQHLLLKKQAAILIPPFFGKRDTSTKEEVMLTKGIAKARKHVERFNERLKKFRTLDRVIPLNLHPIASQMIYVVSCLINFQEYLCV